MSCGFCLNVRLVFRHSLSRNPTGENPRGKTRFGGSFLAGGMKAMEQSRGNQAIAMMKHKTFIPLPNDAAMDCVAQSVPRVAGASRGSRNTRRDACAAGQADSWPQRASNLLRFSLSMNRSADLRSGALVTAVLKRAGSETAALIARFMAPMRVHWWRSRLAIDRRIQHRDLEDTEAGSSPNARFNTATLSPRRLPSAA